MTLGHGLAGWPRIPGRPELPGGVIDVCAADLDRTDEVIAGVLSAEERERAGRLVDERAARRWSCARGLLRSLLGRYLDLAPGAVRFDTSARGKPALAGDDSAALRFSLSRSAGVAVYALSRDRELGIDVEARNRPIRELAIARRAFGRDEIARLAELHQPALRREFLRLWVRHEARVKCLGSGLADPPTAAERDRLWVEEIEVGPGIVAAVAADAQPPGEVRRWAI